MSTQFTPGPWRLDQYRNIVDPTNTVVSVVGVASPCGHVPDNHVGYANGRLLVAAPELLEVARAVVTYCEDQYARQIPPSVYQKALDAIAKAEGR